MRNSLHETNIYVSVNTIWFRPYVYPLISNNHYSDVTQRIYMSATIGDPDDICRRLGTRKITKIPVIDEYSEATIGRRLIIMPALSGDDFSQHFVRALLSVLSSSPKSIWLCTSAAIAERWKYTFLEWLKKQGMTDHPIWMLSTLGEEISEFRKAAKGHLFVSGRFDGMDFHGNECRLVVVPNIPKAINIQEEFLSAYLRDAAFMKRRLNQRIMQALGRCNRDENDFAVYVLADKRFSVHFGRESNRESMSRSVMTEIDMAEDLSEYSLDELQKKISRFVSGDFSEYDTHYQDLQSGLPAQRYPAGEVDSSSGIAPDEVLAWSALFYSKNYQVAAQKFERCWDFAKQHNIRELGAYYGWCWAKAVYLQFLQGSATQSRVIQILEESINGSPARTLEHVFANKS
jgi:hypothetical protein